MIRLCVGIYAHYNQEPAASPIRWGPRLGFYAVLFDVVAGLLVAGIVANLISSEYYYVSSDSSAMAGLTASTIWWIIMDGILAALLYLEYKREGQTGQQTAT